MVTALIDVALTLVGLTVLDWRLGLAGLAPLPIWILATRWYLRTSGPRYAAERTADGAQTQSLVSSLTGAATVRAFRLQARHLHRIRETSDAAVRAGTRARTTSSQFGSVLNGAEMVGVLSILLAGFFLVRSEAITLGAATAAAFYFTRLFSPLMTMLYLLDEAQSAGAALARLIGVTDLPAPPVPAAPRTPQDASIALSGVRFGYDDGPEVLHGIDLALAPGERVAVVGTTGAGKTTLGALVAGVREPREGEIRIGGVPLAELADLRRHVVLVTQEVHVFAGTVADNLRLARPDASRCRAAGGAGPGRGGPRPGRRGRSRRRRAQRHPRPAARPDPAGAGRPGHRDPRRGHRRGGQRGRPGAGGDGRAGAPRSDRDRDRPPADPGGRPPTGWW